MQEKIEHAAQIATLILHSAALYDDSYKAVNSVEYLKACERFNSHYSQAHTEFSFFTVRRMYECVEIICYENKLSHLISEVWAKFSERDAKSWAIEALAAARIKPKKFELPDYWENVCFPSSLCYKSHRGRIFVKSYKPLTRYLPHNIIEIEDTAELREFAVTDDFGVLVPIDTQQTKVYYGQRV